MDEVAVRLTAVGAAEVDPNQKLRPRVRYLRTLIDKPELIAPTHAALVDKLGGRLRDPRIPPLPYATWKANKWAAWNALAGSPASDDLTTFLRSGASYIEETGRAWVDTVRQGEAIAEELGPDADSGQTTRIVASLMAEDWKERIELPGKARIEERYHAYFRFLAIQTANVRRRTEANQAIDLNLLQHLAEAVVIVTRDYALIETVDASETFQAPWVRTIGELIFGTVPSGPPWAFSARRAYAKHKPRRSHDLREIDARAEAIARTELEECEDASKRGPLGRE